MHQNLGQADRIYSFFCLYKVQILVKVQIRSHFYRSS